MGYACDQHQQWADEGCWDDPETVECRRCQWFDASPFPHAGCGVCLLRSSLLELEWRLDTETCEEFSE